MARVKASRSVRSIARSSFGPVNERPSGSVPDASIGTVPSAVRQAPMASKFSRPKPSGSIRLWHDAQVGSARCCSSCCRTDVAVPTPLSSRFGTSGGGSGGGAARMLSRIQRPRSTGEVRVA